MNQPIRWCESLSDIGNAYSYKPSGGDPLLDAISIGFNILTAAALVGCAEEGYHDLFGRKTVYSNPDGMTEWMLPGELISHLAPGDLIEFGPNNDKELMHWGIYKKGSEGQPQVIHLWKAPFVRIDDINYVAADGRKVRRNNKYDLAFPPQNTEEIMDCARQLQTTIFSSQIVNIFCRNGQSISAQANKAKIDVAQFPVLGNIALEAVALFHKAGIS